MDINSQSLLSELRSMSVEARTQVTPLPTAPTQTSFADTLRQAVDNVNGLQKEANDLRTRFDLGDRSVSIGDVMIAANKSGIAFEAAVQVRNKFVEAYKEIMNMPV